MSSVPDSVYSLFTDHGSVDAPHEFIIIPGKDECILHVDNVSLFSVVGDNVNDGNYCHEDNVTDVTYCHEDIVDDGTYCHDSHRTDDTFDVSLVDKSKLRTDVEIDTHERDSNLELCKRNQVFSKVQATLSADIFKTIGTLETVHELCAVCNVQLSFNSDMDCYLAVANQTCNIVQLEDSLFAFLQSTSRLQTPALSVDHSSNTDLLSQTLHQVQLELPISDGQETECDKPDVQPSSDWLGSSMEDTISDNLIPGSCTELDTHDAPVVSLSHEPIFSDVYVLQTSSSKYVCSICSFTSTQMRHLRRHMSTHTTSSNDVSKQQSSSNDTGAIVADMDGDNRQLTVVADKLRCKLCVYETVHRHLFKRHVDTVHGNLRPYLCDVCGRRYKRSDSLAQHRVVHTAQESRVYLHQCPTCQRKFRSLSHLNEHVSTHTSMRSFLCELCGAALKSRSAQRKHMHSIHVEPRSYACPSCSRRFNTSFAMRRHARLHDNITSNITTRTRRSSGTKAPAAKPRRSSKLNELLSIITAK